MHSIILCQSTLVWIVSLYKILIHHHLTTDFRSILLHYDADIYRRKTRSLFYYKAVNHTELEVCTGPGLARDPYRAGTAYKK